MYSVKILWVNARRSNPRLHAILNSNKHADIILVQEPWFNRIGTVRTEFDPEGTDTFGTVANPLWDVLYPKYNPGERCKVVAYRRISSTSFTVINRLDLASNYHTLTIDIHTDTETFRIYNIYHDAHTADTGNETDRASRETRLRSLNYITSLEIDPLVPTVIGGDFNTHARAWSPPDVRQSTWAIDIEEWAIAQGLDLLNTPGIPTRRGDRRQRDTTIDLIWINEAAIHDDTFQNMEIDFTASLGSDHAGLWLTHYTLQAIDHAPPHNWLPPYTIQDAAKEAWINKFRADAHLPAPTTDPAEIEAESIRLSSHIEDTSITIFEQRREYNPRSARWWNNDCQQAVREVRNAATNEEKKAAQKNMRSTIRTAKKDWANNLLRNATTESLWKAARWRHGRRQRNIPALSTEDGLSSDKADMTSALRSRFFKDNPPLVERVFPDDPDPLPQRHFHPIADAEIAEALKDTSNVSAPGKSGHGWKLVKWAWEACPTWFVTLFNSCLDAGMHPKAWKTALIAVVPKPGKSDYSLPKSYRPVALLECLGKLLEKVVTKRILHDVGAHNLVPTNQFGARPHSSTIHAGLALTHDIATAHAKGSCCGSLQLDIQGFFDNINHDRLIHTFHILGFAHKICQWLTSFLTDRIVQLRFNGFVSDPIDIAVGSPQGSPISPILSNIYTFSLLQQANRWSDSRLYMYVDDGNILAWGASYHLVRTRLVARYAECLAWLERAGLTIDGGKTEAIFYSLTRARPDIHGPRPSTITIPTSEGELTTINCSDNVRYLGLFIDHKLTWHRHVKIMATRARGTLKSMKLLGNSVKGLDHGNWRLAYNAICLPVLTYGSPIWFKEQKQLSKILQAVQDEAVRWMMGAFRTTPAEPLHQLIAILPIHIRLKMLSKTAALTLLTIPHSSQLIQRLGPPWCDADELNDDIPLTPHPTPSTPLTRLATLVPQEARRPINFQNRRARLPPQNDRLRALEAIPCGEDRKRLAAQIKQATTNRHNNTLTLFCQGSKPNDRDGTPTGIAVCIAWRLGKEVGHTTKCLGPNASTSDAAYEAILLATNYIRDHLPNNEEGGLTEIRSTDAKIARDCLKSGTRDHHDHIENLAASFSNILDTHASLQINLGWLPAAKGSLPLRRLKAIAAETARQGPTLPPPPPTKAQLRITSRQDAITEWQNRWMEAPRLQPVYLALTNPPDGSVPPFIKGITKFPRPIVATCIRLLTGHAFTGEYTARFRPSSFDPHHCQCGEPMQTAQHVIAACPLHTEARRQFLLPVSNTLSISTIFGTKEGGEALGNFLAASQACIRPWRREAPPEDEEEEDYG